MTREKGVRSSTRVVASVDLNDPGHAEMVPLQQMTFEAAAAVREMIPECLVAVVIVFVPNHERKTITCEAALAGAGPRGLATVVHDSVQAAAAPLRDMMLASADRWDRENPR